MTSRTLFIQSALVASCATVLLANTGYAHERLSTNAVGAASTSAPNLLIKLNLTQQFSESLQIRDKKPTIKAVPEPVCKDHHDPDKMLILGGNESVPM